MSNTLLYQMEQKNKFMMGFVVVTKKDNVIVIDGGRTEDMDSLKKLVGKRHISAWILTHAHDDHIGGFVSEVKKDGLRDFDIERIYYNFPPYELIENHDVLDYENFKADILDCLPAFNDVLPEIKDKTHIVKQGDNLQIDEVRIDFLFSYHEGLNCNLINDSSLVFKLSTPDKSVMFLGDIGPEAGDTLYFESAHLLKSDMVQMAHHGALCCSMEVYAAIEPKVCFWCCDRVDFEGKKHHPVLDDKDLLKKRKWIRMQSTGTVRKWMEQLGVFVHYVAGDGVNKVIL